MATAEDKAKAELAKARAAKAPAAQADAATFEEAEAMMGVHFKLSAVQQRLRVLKERGKGHDPNAGVTYEFRNAEDILERAKPLCAEVGARVDVDVVPDVIGESTPVEIRKMGQDRYGNDILAIMTGPRIVARATAIFTDCRTGDEIRRSSFAIVDPWRKGQTEPEKLCGSADSYASKYALMHLFALDNNKDADMESNERGNSANDNKATAAQVPAAADF